MRPSYPGGFLTLLAILTFAMFGACIYFRLDLMAAICAPLVLCHLGIFYRSRLAGQALIALYVVACLYLVFAFHTHTAFSSSPWRLAGKLAMNVAVMYELRRWLAEQP